MSTPDAAPPSTSPAGHVSSSAPLATPRHLHDKRSFLKRLPRFHLACLLLLYLTSLHLLGLFWFSKGFLLTRITLPNVSTERYDVGLSERAEPFGKAIVLLIDALRTDFLISPDKGSSTYDPMYHGVLTLPSELTASRPSHSLLFDAYADPPTTTMQRLKGLTTGSLPTFIEAGFNFASTEIEEDNLIRQLRSDGKRIGFVGDDTWTNLFPRSFEPGITYPFDSFNVEDLHSVDEGVTKHLLPLLEPGNSSRWDVLIGHCLGVDHVGHRMEPASSVMTTKLSQMNVLIWDIVRGMDEETLLVVLGDHGMTPKGDHGGDGDAETSAGLWFFSKGRALVDLGLANAPRLAGTMPRAQVMRKGSIARRVNQIDLVPTLSSLLGIPIPFNNLGSIIPELFTPGRGASELAAAMRENAQQIKNYIDSYAGDIGRARLDVKWYEAEDTDANADPVESFLRHRTFALDTLEHLRARWAQFSIGEMILGLILLILSVPTSLALYTGVRNTRAGWTIYVSEALEIAIRAGAMGGSVVGTFRGLYTRSPGQALLWAVTSGGIVSELAIIVPLAPAVGKSMWTAVVTRPTLAVIVGPLILLAHCVAFGANSFILWEDRMVQFFLASLLLLPAIKAFSATMPRLRLRIFGFSVLAIVLSRLIGLSTICREEQQPYCRAAFYGGEGAPISTTSLLTIALGLSWYLPILLNMFLGISKSDAGPATIFLQGARSQLVGGGLYWVLEWLEASSKLQPARIPLVQLFKAWLARIIIGMTAGAGSVIWAIMPLCISITRQTEQDGGESKVVVYGFANSYGSSYLLFLLIPLSILVLITPAAGQIALILAVLIILAHLEAVDSQRDSRSVAQSFAGTSQPGEFEGATTAIQQPTFSEIAVYAVLGHVTFFATGHQAVLSTIQWKAAFVGVTQVVMPYSPALVILNTWAGPLFIALAVPLLACWNVSPGRTAGTPVLADALQASLGMIVYTSSLAVGCAIATAWLRRHLMVWNVFAPRFMLAGATLVMTDVGLLLGIGLGLRIVSGKVLRTYKAVTL